ncbi:hypothetical protein PINS_up001586 [Pythium insidiosum]|nr:hypothetical protein PINS_up001586 [Pythium insidiosum]
MSSHTQIEAQCFTSDTEAIASSSGEERNHKTVDDITQQVPLDGPQLDEVRQSESTTHVSLEVESCDPAAQQSDVVDSLPSESEDPAPSPPGCAGDKLIREMEGPIDEGHKSLASSVEAEGDYSSCAFEEEIESSGESIEEDSDYGADTMVLPRDCVPCLEEAADIKITVGVEEQNDRRRDVLEPESAGSASQGICRIQANGYDERCVDLETVAARRLQQWYRHLTVVADRDEPRDSTSTTVAAAQDSSDTDGCDVSSEKEDVIREIESAISELEMEEERSSQSSSGAREPRDDEQVSSESPTSNVRAATLIQRQFRCFVARRLLLEQAAFLARQHRRQTRKENRRLSASGSSALEVSAESVISEAPKSPTESMAMMSAEKVEDEQPLEGDFSSDQGEVVATAVSQQKQEFIESMPRHDEEKTSGGTWERYMDHDNNKSFYFNPERRVSQWERPSQEEWSLRRSQSMSTEKRGEWQAFVDAATQQPFYYNARTGESTWEKPPAFAQTTTTTATTKSAWIQCTDPATSQIYYLNVETQQTTWELPPELHRIHERTSRGVDEESDEDDEGVDDDDDRGDHDYLICIDDDDHHALDGL